MNRMDYQFADLTDRELDKIREAEKFLNTQPDHAGRGEEIILLAYKPSEMHSMPR